MSSLKSRSTILIRGEAMRSHPAGLTACLALDEQTKAQAYGLRYKSYVSGGYIDQRPDGLFWDADDLLPNSRSVVIYKYGQPVASFRLCARINDPALPDWNEIPASRIFPEEVEALARSLDPVKPVRLVEINRLVRHPDYATDVELVFIMFRLSTFLVIEEGAQMVLNCVRRNHTPFYKRMHFEYVAGPRRYAGVKFETNLMKFTEDSYSPLMRDVPFIATDKRAEAAYSQMKHGQTVPVFYENTDG